jgi:hypothetical protein
MKKSNLVLLICLIIVLFIGYFTYQNLNKQKITINDSCITDITQKVKNIEMNISKYSMATKDIIGKTTEGGQQTDYIFEGKKVLIKQIFFGETGKSEVNYYLENNKVYYFKKINTEYLLPISEDSSGKIKNIDTKEFYLDNNQNICSWYLNQKLQLNDQDTKDLTQYLLSSL